jgi:hypothetical protein
MRIAATVAALAAALTLAACNATSHKAAPVPPVTGSIAVEAASTTTEPTTAAKAPPTTRASTVATATTVKPTTTAPRPAPVTHASTSTTAAGPPPTCSASQLSPITANVVPGAIAIRVTNRGSSTCTVDRWPTVHYAGPGGTYVTGVADAQWPPLAPGASATMNAPDTTVPHGTYTVTIVLGDITLPPFTATI